MNEEEGSLLAVQIIGKFLTFFYYVAIVWSLVLHVYFKIGLTSEPGLRTFLQVLQFVLTEDACDFVWSPRTCVAFRLPVFYAFIGLILTVCVDFPALQASRSATALCWWSGHSRLSAERVPAGGDSVGRSLPFL